MGLEKLNLVTFVIDKARVWSTGGRHWVIACSKFGLVNQRDRIHGASRKTRWKEKNKLGGQSFEFEEPEGYFKENLQILY